jgi:hypothetical protein
MMTSWRALSAGTRTCSDGLPLRLRCWRALRPSVGYRCTGCKLLHCSGSSFGERGLEIVRARSPLNARSCGERASQRMLLCTASNVPVHFLAQRYSFSISVSVCDVFSWISCGRLVTAMERFATSFGSERTVGLQFCSGDTFPSIGQSARIRIAGHWEWCSRTDFLSGSRT